MMTASTQGIRMSALLAVLLGVVSFSSVMVLGDDYNNGYNNGGYNGYGGNGYNGNGYNGYGNGYNGYGNNRYGNNRGYGNNGRYGNNGGGSSANANANANANSFGGNSQASANANANAQSNGGNQFGRRMLAIPSFQDFMSSMGFASAPNLKTPAREIEIGSKANNIVELEDHFAVYFAVPGFNDADAVSAEFDDGVLSVSGHKETVQKMSHHAVEQVSSAVLSSSFSHSFAVPANIRGCKVTAHVVDGVLMIKMPKLPAQ